MWLECSNHFGATSFKCHKMVVSLNGELTDNFSLMKKNALCICKSSVVFGEKAI